MLPNFIIIGAQKAGTTAFRGRLSFHPEIYMVKNEIHYFNDRLITSPRKRTYSELGIDWYKSKFNEFNGEKAVGEKSPDYCYDSNVPKRMYELLPDAKLIMIVRNPVDRAFSSYKHQVVAGRENLSLEEAIGRESFRMKHNPDGLLHFSYLYQGYYFNHITRFLEYYDKNKCLFITFEELCTNPKQVFKDTFEFLEVDSSFTNKRFKEYSPRVEYIDISPIRGINKGKKISIKLNSDTRKLLEKVYAKHNRKLEQLIDKEIQW